MVKVKPLVNILNGIKGQKYSSENHPLLQLLFYSINFKMSTSIRVFLLFAIFTGVVEMCGSLSSQSTPAETNTASTPTGQTVGRKRRSVDGSSIVHIEFQTTLTTAGEMEFSKAENELTEEYEELLDKALRQVATGVDGGSVLKYMFIETDCGIAQLFAQAVKDLNSFVTGATIRCNDQISNI
ncbi:hypothetical protein CRE_25074 [Caenorhabditis remanei]|uniref:SEA domain-containing protein n=1 Tax=Caenorhabditis remanei TaxID=31234 RepID=E3LSS2_CAERE|nr:hypothetical protein CRE_25074 [Caenorhabditis remanei]